MMEHSGCRCVERIRSVVELRRNSLLGGAVVVPFGMDRVVMRGRIGGYSGRSAWGWLVSIGIGFGGATVAAAAVVVLRWRFGGCRS